MHVSIRNRSMVAAALAGVVAIASTACVAQPAPLQLGACATSLGSVADGFAPQVSGDGSVLGYLRADVAGVRRVWVQTASRTALPATAESVNVRSFVLSGDGRWVVFVADLGGGRVQVRRTNIASGTSDDLTAPVAASSTSFDLSVSYDGSAVAFAADATALGSRGSGVDVAVWTADATTVVSQPRGATTWTGSSGAPALSADGATVAFATTTDLDPDTPMSGHQQVVTVELETGAVSTVSATGGAVGNGDSTDPSISADGQTVMFSTEASNLAEGAAPAYGRVVVSSLSRAGASWATPTAVGSATMSPSVVQYGVELSADGTRGAFLEVSSPATPERARHVVTWTRASGELTPIASRSEWTQTPTWRGNGLALTADGAQVFFDADTVGAAPRPLIMRWSGC